MQGLKRVSCFEDYSKARNWQCHITRPMPIIGTRCHELRINDEDLTWRITHRIESDAIVILDVFEKKTNRTPKGVIGICKDRLKVYNREIK